MTDTNIFGFLRRKPTFDETNEAFRAKHKKPVCGVGYIVRPVIVQNRVVSVSYQPVNGKVPPWGEKHTMVKA